MHSSNTRSTPRWPHALAIAAWLALAGCATSLDQRSSETLPPLPEGASGHVAKPGWQAQRFAVAAANPLATEAGYRVLKAGGTAVDAAVAVQMVLGLVEPQSSGLAGGAFLLHWDGRQVQAWDGRETAPAAADERLFIGPDGKPMPLQAAVVGGRSVGVPGAVRMLEAAHRQHGRLPWAQLIQPAIQLAEQGFPMSPRLHTQLAGESALRTDPRAAAYFYRPDGAPHPIGRPMPNPAMAAVLRQIAERGSAALHSGAVAADIVARVQNHPVNPGRMTLADLSAYQPVQREPICTLWKQVYRVCGMPPPSSGHLAVMQILGILERLPPGGPPQRQGLPAPDWLHRYTEAARLAYADRNEVVADPAFVPAPRGDWRTMLDPAYLSQRAALIGERSMGQAAPGNLGLPARVAGPVEAYPEHGTSHISIVDGEGHSVAMTTTIEAVFGSRVMSDGGTGLPGGFLLNNQLTDFSPAPADAQGRAIANRVQPGKRPRSSMSPTLVFDARDGRLLMSVGSPGGAAIIHFTSKTLIGTLDWGLDAQRAIDLPNFGSYNGPTVLEQGRFPAETVKALEQRGHKVLQSDMTSGLQALQRRGAGWFGGADPRREGVVMGD